MRNWNCLPRDLQSSSKQRKETIGTSPPSSIRNPRVTLVEPPKERRTRTLKAIDVIMSVLVLGIQSECPNYNKSKGKAMNMTLSDELDSNDSDKPTDKNGNFMAFTAFVKSSGESSEYASPDMGESSEDDYDDGDDLQVAYTKFFEKCIEKKKRRKENSLMISLKRC